MTRIKLCGLSRPVDIEVANALEVDFIGFVFARKSRRWVPPERAAALRRELKGGIQAVGVFVRERPEAVAALLNEGVIDLAQLHGGEDEDYIHALKALTDRPIIRAFRVEKRADLLAANDSAADLVLLDNGAGGTGEAFDWSVLRDFHRPYILAGGLYPDNVGEAVRALRPWGVDVSSGIETDGVKDADKMRAFVEAVRGVSAALS